MVPIVVKRLGKGRRSGSDENAYSRRGSFNVVSCKTVLVGLARFLGVGGLVSVRLTGFAPFFCLNVSGVAAVCTLIWNKT